MDDRLYRSVDDRMLAGVAGGVAERLDADPSIIRVVWALLVVLTGGIALVAYLVMAVVVPDAPDGEHLEPAGPAPEPAGPAAEPAGPAAEPARPAPDPDAPTAATEGSWLIEGGTAAAAAAVAAVAPSATPAAGPAAPGSAAVPGPASTPGSAGAWIAPNGQTVARASSPTASRRRRSGAGGDDDRGSLIGGLILIMIGGFFLLRQFIPAIDLGSWWPLILVGIGVILVIMSVIPGRKPG